MSTTKLFDLLNHKVIPSLHLVWEATRRREVSHDKGVKDSGVKPSRRGVSSRYRGDLYLAIPENRQYVLWLAPFSVELHGKFLGRPPITAEIYGARQTNRQLAEEFWSYVLKENHPEPDHENAGARAGA